MSSDPPDSDKEEVTGIHSIPSGMRDWARSYSRKVRKVERHFEAGGVVHEMDRKLDRFMTKHETERGLAGKVPIVLGALVVLVGALGWFVVATMKSQPVPVQPSAQDIAREVIKAQQK